MTRTARGSRLLSLSFYVHRIVFLATVFLAGGCAWTNTVPAKFVRQAEPGVTLTSLAGRPEVYKGKVVILGGVIAEEKRADGRVWLWVKNRPLDADYEPHRDASRTPSESGHYWVVVDLRGLPQGYRSWARLTVVGQVLYRAGPAIRCAVH